MQLSKTIIALSLGVFSFVYAQEVKADIAYQEGKSVRNIKQLTFEKEKSGEGYFSPDGKKIIFQSIRDGGKFYQIYMMNVDGSDVKMISSGRGKTTCSYFSPDGKKIIYASSHLDPKSEIEQPKNARGYSWDFEKSMDIFEANLDGSDLKRLTKADGYDAEGVYSSDGKKIIFTSQRDGDLELYVMDKDGKNQKRLTKHKGYDGGAFFSPNNKHIVFRRFDDKGNAQIILADADGKNEKYLTNSQAINWCPAFHPDGKHIIFSSNMNEARNFDLYIMDLDGNHLRQITFDSASDVLPTFSPDGKKLMWTSTRVGKTSQIFIGDFQEQIFFEPLMYPKQVFEDIKYLASDSLEGRRSGSVGAELASKYISASFKKDNLKTFKKAIEGTKSVLKDKKVVKQNDNPYLQDFSVMTGIKLAKNNTLVLDNSTLKVSKDYIPLNFSENGKVSGDIVFAGYGISAPEYKYDDYKGLDVKDKTVLLLRYEPQEKDPKSVFNGDKPTDYSSFGYKLFNAKKHGAKAVVLVNGLTNYQDEKQELMSFQNNTSMTSSGIPFIQVKNEAIAKILKKENYDLKKLQENIDADLKPNSFKLNAKLNLSVDLKREVKNTSNVIGFIEGTDDALKNEVIVIGAHYDHLGMGGEGSLSESKDPMIHNGADDNASGTAGLMELSRRLSKMKTKRTIAFMAFSGEELGLLGSNYFNNNPFFKDKKIVSMINMDMIGRLEKNGLTIGGIKTGKSFKNTVDHINSFYDFKLGYFDDGYGPSDHMSFYLKGIPVLFFFTGMHSDYHKPSDDYYKLNLIGLGKIVSFVQDIVLKIDQEKEKPEYVKIAPPKNMSASTGKGHGAYIGAIPEYSSMNSSETNGVKISGVKEGSPAEKGGVKEGDIIIKFDNVKIGNIYDYTYAIKSKKPGDKVEMVVKRADKEVKLEIIVGKKN